ncbi:unnamed protein product, partial [Heterobilharzia americana]
MQPYSLFTIKMSAGAVRAPLIIPLRSPDSGLYKSHLDTNTYLELTCDTPNVGIYFTINGSKPMVAKSRKELTKTGTYKFYKPFTLPPGCHILRAVAVSLENGNESSVVTKTFDVVKAKTYQDGDKADHVDDYGFLNELKSSGYKHRTQMSDIDHLVTRDSTGRFVDKSEENVQKCTSDKKWFHVMKKPTKDQENQVDFRNERTLSANRQNDNGSVRSSLIDEYPELSSHMINRLQQKTDILRCPYCHHPRPLSRKQNYCFHCGMNLPVPSLPKRDPYALENIGVCPYCKAHIPVNLPSCLVCEAPLQMSQIQKYGQYPKESRLCTTCGTMNPTDIRSCVMCEARLSTDATNVILSGVQSAYDSRPPVPHSHEGKMKYSELGKFVRFSTCAYCNRENNPDARYCDWCGLEVPKQCSQQFNSELRSADSNQQNIDTNTLGASQNVPLNVHHNRLDYDDNHNSNNKKPFLSSDFIHCIKCDLPNPKEANYCSYCGLNLMPPPRCTRWYPTSHTPGYNELEIENQSEKPVPQYRSIQTVVANVSTQTVGLFYPSSTDLRRQDQLAQNRSVPDVQLRDRTPILTTVSPGKGFWRKQLDHIFAHLKLYTNNNSEFRASIGQPRFGKLLSADLCEASNQAKITLIYSLSNDKKNNISETGNHTTSSKITLDSDYDDDKLSHLNKYPSQLKQNPDDLRKINGQDGFKEQQSSNGKLYVRQSPSSFPLKDEDQYETMRSSPNRKDHTYGINVTQLPPKSPQEVYENKSKTSSIEPEEDESRHITKSNKSISSTRQDKSSRLHSNPHAQYGETGVALLRNSKLSTSDVNLLYALSQRNIDIHEVKRLLKEGANPNCMNAAKETPLICAVRHGHVEAISVLEENGAKIDTAATSIGNTALHEAVLRGMDGLDLARELLRCGANMKVENSRKETPHSIVLRSNCEPLIRLFALHLGHQQLKELTEDTDNQSDL